MDSNSNHQISKAPSSTKLKGLSDALLQASATILFITGGVKLISAFQSVRLLNYYDPVFQILTNRQVLLFTGIGELLLAGTILLPVLHRLYKGTMILWFSLACFSYRLWKVIEDVRSPCKCLGNVGDWLHIRPDTMNSLAMILLAGLFVGGLIVVLLEFKHLFCMDKGQKF